MSINELQQLEAFAYWRQRVMATEKAKALWGLRSAVETKLMNQAPLYALNGARVDLFAEATLAGAVVDKLLERNDVLGYGYVYAGGKPR